MPREVNLSLSLSASKDKLLAEATKEKKKAKNSQLVVLPSHPTPYWCSPSRMGETFKTLQQWATKAATPQLPSLLHFLTRKVQRRMAAQCYPASSKSSRKRSTSPLEQPCSTTSRGSRHCAPHTPRPKACQRTSLPSCASRTWHTVPLPPRDCRVPKSSTSFRITGSFFAMWPVLLCDTPAAGCRAHSHDSPRVQKRPRSSHPKSPSQAVCRLFILAPLTVIRPRTGAESAKNHVNPNVSTLTGSNKFTLIPLQTFPPPSVEQPLDFSSVLPTCPSGFGFFPECLL